MKKNMDMQDKEFDKIFNSKFEDFQVEPSPMVWDNIADELDGKKGKRSLAPYLSIAASVIVLLTTGVLFLQKQDQTTVQHSNPAKFTANSIKPVVPVTTEPVTTITAVKPTTIEKPIDRVAATASNQPKRISPVNKITAPTVTNTQPVVKDLQPVKTESPQLIAAVSPPVTNPLKATVPDVQLSPKSTDVIAQAPVERPTVMASNVEAAPAKKHGIRSLGGLINVLIAKVDKRDDKLIEFSDSDDDDAESNVTGVNLGVIKIKRQ
jgi:low affinity Fe/Cu permease